MSNHNFEQRFEERLRKKAFAHYDCNSMIVDFGGPSKYRILQERRNTTTGASAASLAPTPNTTNVNNVQNPASQNNHLLNLSNNQNGNSNHRQQQLYGNNQHFNSYQTTFDPQQPSNLFNEHHFNVNNNNNSTNNANINHQNNDLDNEKKKASNRNEGEHIDEQATGDLDPVDGANLPDSGDGRENDLVLACPFFRNELGGEEERIVCLNKLTDRRQTTKITELHKPSFASGISILEGTHCPYKNICPYQRNLHAIDPLIDYADAGATYYRDYFFDKEHQNWFGQSESYGPLAISILKEPIRETNQTHIITSRSSRNNLTADIKFHYRIILRTSELAVLRGSVYEDCIPNLTNRNNTREVLEYLLSKSDIPLPKLRLGTPEAKDRLLKLDEDRLIKNYKVGVLYCQAGQSTEEEFYNNENSGVLFEEFLSCIGEKVRLLGFNKYRGGLDNKSDSTGLYSVYSTYNDSEIMFHVSTLLPYSANNRQQLPRKRHIGNDIVTIVFQEEGALPFTPKTIRSQFQHVFIVVKVTNMPMLPASYDPRASRQYSVAVSRSKEMPPFGPPINESGTFIRSQEFRNFLLAKIINAENAAHKYCEKFRSISQRARLGILTDLTQKYVTNTTLSDYNGGSNSGTSGAVKIVSSFFGGKKRVQRRYANFCGHSDIQGSIVWDVQVKDFGQSNKIIDCILGISSTYLVVLEQASKEILYASPVEAILGWTSNPAWIKIFCHQAECLFIQIKDPDVDEICEIVTRLKAVTNGSETRELTLRRKSLDPLGFDIQPDGVVTRVEPANIAWQAHLLPGSRLVEICKTSTATLSYSQMMEYIRTSAVVTLTALPPNNDGSCRRGCLSQNCAHHPIISTATTTSTSSNTHYTKAKRRIPSVNLMTLV